ncbi:MAG TPA: COX15/CtaA family protein [Limnochordales bacterium]
MGDRAAPAVARGAQAVAGLAVAVVVAGGIVRVTGAGLGCPDWPLCYGQVVPPTWGPAAIEFAHRLVAGVFSLGVAWLAWAAWRQRGGRRRRSGTAAGQAAWAQGALAKAGLAALALVLVQVVLGGLNVLTELAPAVGGTHLAVAMGLVALLAAAAEFARLAEGQPAAAVPRQVAGRRLSWAAASLALVLLVVSLGGFMRATGASLACYDWPLCRGRLFPEPAWPVVLHWSHRAAALGLGVALAAGTVRGGGRLGWGLGLYVLQSAVGALSIWWMLPGWLRVAHLALAALVVAVLGSEVARSRAALAAGSGLAGSRMAAAEGRL